MLYFLCPDVEEPTGGIKVIYSIVDTLNENNKQAKVLHFTDKFRCTWFENTTEVGYINKEQFGPYDITFIPEVAVPGLWNQLSLISARKVILVQGGYLVPPVMLQGLNNGAQLDPSPYDEALAVVCISEDTTEFIQMMYPKAKVYSITSYINKEIFNYDQTIEKNPNICFMPRRNYEHVYAISTMLKENGWLETFNLTPIHNMSEAQVAQTLKESAFFLSVATLEGFNLPAAEAMACGCNVIGWHGFGGKEFFLEEFSYVSQPLNLFELKDKVLEAINDYQNNPAKILENSKNASQYILNKYSKENWTNRLVETIEVLEGEINAKRTFNNINLKPKVTVGICSYNQLHYLKQAVKSVKEQTIPCKIIVSDDGSTDGTKEWLRAQNFSSITHSDNIGSMVRAWDDILERVDTEWLILLSGDDMLFPNAAELISSVENADWVYGGLQLIDENNNPIGYWDLSHWPTSNEYALKWTWDTYCVPYTMFAGFRVPWIKENNLRTYPLEGTRYGQDTPTSIMWVKDGNPRAVRLAAPLFYYRQHKDSDTSKNFSTDEMKEDFHIRLRKFMKEHFSEEQIQEWEGK